MTPVSTGSPPSTAKSPVVGQAAVEVLDELGGGEVPDPKAGLDCGVPERDQGVALAGAGRRAWTTFLAESVAGAVSATSASRR